MHKSRRRSSAALGLAAVATAVTALSLLTLSPRAQAFCGFYVSGASAELSNDATMVVMMRDGMRTVLSMQNNYKGPPEDFAMVVPVPVVLKKEDVKTLDDKIFAKVDAMAAPRLVEYWERDPCMPDYPRRKVKRNGRSESAKAKKSEKRDKSGVKIEAQFKVGEYEIVILSASDSSSLDTWLRAKKYNVPAEAKAAYQPYIDNGQYFFVAKVDVKKVGFEDGRAKLSPLRFHYDTKAFSLPVRLGLLNASGPQDLIVHILAKGQRYEVANYKNATIPTNIDVTKDVKSQFGAFYAELFDGTLAQNKGAVITEYAWDASTCDPCPGPNLNGADFLSLGADVLPGKPQFGFVLTRLHARYTKEELKDDLVFEAAPPIAGGREVYKGEQDLENGAIPNARNSFQGRYAIRHIWEGKLECQNPIRGRWGGPPGQPRPQPTPARDLAFAKRGAVKLGDVLRRDVPELELKAKTSTLALLNLPPTKPLVGGVAGELTQSEVKLEASQADLPAPKGATSSGCAVTKPAGGDSVPPLLALVLLTVGLLVRRSGRQ